MSSSRYASGPSQRAASINNASRRNTSCRPPLYSYPNLGSQRRLSKTTAVLILLCTFVGVHAYAGIEAMIASADMISVYRMRHIDMESDTQTTAMVRPASFD